MTSPHSENEPAGQRRAGVPSKDDVRRDPTLADARAGDLGTDPADDRRLTSNNVDASRYEYAETALGGADSVEKTTYVTGEGTEPEGAPRASVVARTSAGSGINVAAWVIGLVAALIAAIYMLGIFR